MSEDGGADGHGQEHQGEGNQGFEVRRLVRRLVGQRAGDERTRPQRGLKPDRGQEPLQLLPFHVTRPAEPDRESRHGRKEREDPQHAGRQGQQVEQPSGGGVRTIDDLRTEHQLAE